MSAPTIPAAQHAPSSSGGPEQPEPPPHHAAPPNVPTKEFFDTKGLDYETIYGHNAGLLKAVDKFAARLRPGCRVLDLGCGTGRPVAHTLAARGFHVHGVDFSETMVGLSRTAVPSGTFECAHLLDWVPPAPATDETDQELFGGIVATSSFYELAREQMETLVSRWRGWLAPGGAALLMMVAAEDVVPGTRPEMYDADGRFARGIPFRFMGDDCFLYLFTRAGWRALLEEKGGLVVREQWAGAFVPAGQADCDAEMNSFFIVEKEEG
ncbi:hypothetical protein PG994_004520 [Apiospora phragmitis]|uniref:Class I SAM-dependent methyltransferase n=1 Tax=Apiospora phragmitis TaxID=2905665 RepID=A0ABR1VQU1_9PEZI